jgi:Fuc2NAc and GlcNAc transferase
MINMVVLLLIVFFCSYIVTAVMRRYAIANNIYDVPNSRSSHTLKTPRGGGVSIVIVFLGVLVFLWWSTGISDGSLILSILLGGSFVAMIGFWDDHQHIPARWRFFAHLFAAIVSLSFLPELPELKVFSTAFDISAVTYPFYVLMLIWLLNLYNFMDGIDGIASIEAITVSVSAAVILLLNESEAEAQILLILSACVAGFLVWNWPPAKIFMGDASSGFLGFTLGLMAVITSNNDAISIWSWFILLAVFVADATYTLIRRMVNGDKWYEAHRSHAYQILSRQHRSQKKVTVAVLIVNIAWLFPLAYLATKYEYWASLICIIAMLPLIVSAYNVDAGIQND